MTTLFSLPFMLPTIYMIQMVSLFGSSSPVAATNYLSDLD
jgi:hypothetical protein